MFIDFINAIFAGCTSDMDKFFVIVLFIFVLELIGDTIRALVGGARH